MNVIEIFIILVVPLGIISLIAFAIFCDKKEQKEQERRLHEQRKRIQERLKVIEPLARKGDLVAFQEWQRLTGNYTVVDVRKIPDMEFTSVGVSV